MLRQLARLTRPVPAAGADALALAVYSDSAGELVVAKESGFEGVACVDDAARLLDVACGVWERTRDPGLERWARGLLEFVLSMQGDDGRWWNFIYDWSGTRNESGITSSTGENFWHARALCGVSQAALTFGDERALAATRRGLAYTLASSAPADVRALHVIVGLRLVQDPSFGEIGAALHLWTEEIAANRIGEVMMNNPDERGEPHLWAHIQEGVLVDAGRALGKPELIDVACASARALWRPFVLDGFDRPSVTPYDVACAVYSLDRLASLDPAEWAGSADAARAWFDRTDAAGRAVYDRTSGRIADGIDGGDVSENSGAEANVVAAEALFEEAVRSAVAAVALLPRPSNG